MAKMIYYNEEEMRDVLNSNGKEVEKMTKENKIDYKFNEANTIAQIKRYVDGTYERHYGYGQYQATDMIIDADHGEGFCIGNIMKYAMRYGKKNGKDYQDLLKIIHYAIILLSTSHQAKTNKGLFTND